MYLNVEGYKKNGGDFVKEGLVDALDSLSFLRKPQRCRAFKSYYSMDEELARNTKLNKIAIEDSDSGGISPKCSRTYEEKDRFHNDTDPDAAYAASPTPSIGDGDFLGGFSPVYKKSGELLKSSLKKRSMSLPNHMYDQATTSVKRAPDGSLRSRSKSVHFDSKAPVKYFSKDKSSIDISNLEEELGSLNITRRPLTSSTALFPEDDDVLFYKDISTIENKIKNSLPKRQVPEKHEDNRICGLYNVNFPILSNKNPKSLKLNIFINLAQQKKCFLQDITLHIQKNVMNSHSYTKSNILTTFIMGRVLVKNIYFNKSVIIRYTLNRWRTSHDTHCMYLSDAQSILPGTDMDLFKFIIDYNEIKSSRGELEFCIQYLSSSVEKSVEYWDNNNGKNYKVDIIMNGSINPFL